MGQLSSKLRNAEGGRLMFWCPGCDSAHSIAHGEGPGPRWGWNGNAERPVFTPSVLTWWDEPANLHDHDAMQRDLAEARRRREAGEQNVKVPTVARRCHSFVGCNGAQPGQIVFLSDCTHALAGQTVDLPDWPRHED